MALAFESRGRSRCFSVQPYPHAHTLALPIDTFENSSTFETSLLKTVPMAYLPTSTKVVLVDTTILSS